MKGLEPEWPNLNVLLITHHTGIVLRIELEMHNRDWDPFCMVMQGLSIKAQYYHTMQYMVGIIPGNAVLKH